MAQLELSFSILVRYPSRPDRMNTAPTRSSPALGAGTTRHLKLVRERFPFDIAISFHRQARRCLSSKSYTPQESLGPLGVSAVRAYQLPAVVLNPSSFSG